MNLPNKITVFRAGLIPAFTILALIPSLLCQTLAAILFGVASFSDFVDGHLARRRNLVTNFGKFMDPLADKMLVMAAMLCLVSLGRLPAWAVIIILCREFMVDGLRLLAAERGVVIAASPWGKRKTACQMVMVIVLLLAGWFSSQWYLWLCRGLIALALVLTVYSGWDYLYKGRSYVR